MNSIGIDVSKGKSMVTVLLLFGEVVLEPFEVNNSVSELKELIKTLKSIYGELKVFMESTSAHRQCTF